MIVMVVCQLITWCYPFEDKSPISKKEWDSAAEGAEWAVASGQTRVFAFGEDLDGLKERQRTFAYTNDESYAPPLPPAASKDGSTSINNCNLADDQPSPADLLSFPGQDGDGNLNQPISIRVPCLIIPISGEYNISCLVTPGSSRFSYSRIRPHPVRRWSRLNFQFVAGSGSDGQHYGIFGHGVYRNGFSAGQQIVKFRMVCITQRLELAGGSILWISDRIPKRWMLRISIFIWRIAPNWIHRSFLV
jgi:hypothetical protein